MDSLEFAGTDASPAERLKGASRGRLAWAFGSLKVRITLAGVAALLLGIGLITLLLVNRAERDTLEIQRKRERIETSRTAKLLAGNVIHLQRDLRAAASRLGPETVADDRALDHFIEAQAVLRTRFDSIFVIAPDGHLRLVTDEAGLRHPTMRLNDREYFRRTLAEDRPVVSEVIKSRLTGIPIVILTQPVRGPDGIVAVLAGSLRLTSRDLVADLVSSGEPDAKDLVIVTDAQGQVLAHPDPRRVMRPLAEEPRLAQAYAAWLAQGRPIEPSGLDLPQAGEVASAAGVAGPDWMVWRVRPEAEMLAPLRAARHDSIGWAAGLIALLSAGLLTFLWWLLRPMVLLEQRAQRLFDGELDAHAGWPAASGEIGRLAHVLRHVGAERARLESFNTEVLRKLGSVMSAAPIGIAFTRDQRFELVSAEFCRMFGHDESALLGQHTRMIYATDEDYARLGPLVGQAFGAGHAYLGDWQLRHADGTTFWASVRGNPVATDDPSAGTIWTATDISDQRIQTEQLTWSATHDALTGLANRKLFEQRSASVVASGALGLPATMVFIDLDRFKPINDTAGHAAGDAMLRAVAAALLGTVRNSDLVARLGGDEFAVLLEHCGVEVAARIAENARMAIDSIALPWEGGTFGVGASLGLACLNADTVGAAEWQAAADAACYAAKAAGRGVVRIAAEARGTALRLPTSTPASHAAIN